MKNASILLNYCFMVQQPLELSDRGEILLPFEFTRWSMLTSSLMGPSVLSRPITWWCCLALSCRRSRGCRFWSFTDRALWVFSSLSRCRFRNCLHYGFVFISSLCLQLLLSLQLLLVLCRLVFIWQQWHGDADRADSINLECNNIQNERCGRTTAKLAIVLELTCSFRQVLVLLTTCINHMSSRLIFNHGIC